MKRAVAFTLALALVLVAGTGRADTFAAGSYIIPMDTTYQDRGMLRAYGLVYDLVRRGIPVRWVVNPAKAYQGTDFTASAVDLRTNAQIANYGYRGGPFVIDSANAAAALPYIQAWATPSPTAPSVNVHSATAPFSGTVAKVLVVAPRIALHADGNQVIAITYLNAAGITDSQRNAWPATSPDVLTPAQIAGPTTTNHQDGALFDANGVPLFCQVLSMDWNVGAAATSPETIREVQSFLAYPTRFFAANQAVAAFENTAHLLTTGGLQFAAQALSVDYYNPTSLVAQIDGTFQAIGGAWPSYKPASGSAYKAAGGVILTGHGVVPGGGQDVFMTGFTDGSCPPNASTCGSLGKVSYLGGHEYNTNTPISQNPQTQGVRLFLNSLFDSQCSSQTGVK
jgi:hypothetical protein